METRNGKVEMCACPATENWLITVQFKVNCINSSQTFSFCSVGELFRLVKRAEETAVSIFFFSISISQSRSRGFLQVNEK